MIESRGRESNSWQEQQTHDISLCKQRCLLFNLFGKQSMQIITHQMPHDINTIRIRRRKKGSKLLISSFRSIFAQEGRQTNAIFTRRTSAHMWSRGYQSRFPVPFSLGRGKGVFLYLSYMVMCRCEGYQVFRPFHAVYFGV